MTLAFMLNIAVQRAPLAFTRLTRLLHSLPQFFKYPFSKLSLSFNAKLPEVKARTRV